MKLGRAALGLLASLAIAVVTLALGEGLWSLWNLGRPHTSLVSRLWRLPPPPPPPGEPAAATVLRRSQFEELLDTFVADGVGLGNTPYRRTRTERAAINEEIDGCSRPKAGTRKVVTQIRTHLFNPLDPVLAFWNADSSLSPEVRHFLDAYGFRETRYTVNERGERLTLPEVEARDVVLVAGDSVAAGAGVGDAETLASLLQARDAGRRFVNLGINGAAATDIACALDRAGEDYAGRIVWLVYVYCENDFEPDEPLGEPEEVIDNLISVRSRDRIPRVSVVFSPHIYNVAPQATRFPGMRGDAFPYFASEKRRLREAVQAAGFEWIDLSELVLEASRDSSSQFAPLAYFIDHIHLSVEGTRLLADRLLDRTPSGDVVDERRHGGPAAPWRAPQGQR